MNSALDRPLREPGDFHDLFVGELLDVAQSIVPVRDVHRAQGGEREGGNHRGIAPPGGQLHQHAGLVVGKGIDGPDSGTPGNQRHHHREQRLAAHQTGEADELVGAVDVLDRAGAEQQRPHHQDVVDHVEETGREAEATALAKMALTIEEHYGRPMDVEWGKDGETGELFILQARPETVKSRSGQTLERFRLESRGPVLAEGRAIGQRIGQGMEQHMAGMAGYLVLMFFAAQFVSYFSWSQLGLISAVRGAEWLQVLNPGPAVLMVGFVLFAALVNLMVGSATAKWALLAPAFIPMLMIAGISPEVTQMAYRVGDSTTNIITPLMPYFGVVVAFAQRYDRNIGIGTIIATMLPYSMFFFIFWVILFYVWVFLFGLPVGPGSPTYYPVN